MQLRGKYLRMATEPVNGRKPQTNPQTSAIICRCQCRVFSSSNLVGSLRPTTGAACDADRAATAAAEVFLDMRGSGAQSAPCLKRSAVGGGKCSVSFCRNSLVFFRDQSCSFLQGHTAAAAHHGPSSCYRKIRSL